MHLALFYTPIAHKIVIMGAWKKPLIESVLLHTNRTSLSLTQIFNHFQLEVCPNNMSLMRVYKGIYLDLSLYQSSEHWLCCWVYKVQSWANDSYKHIGLILT